MEELLKQIKKAAESMLRDATAQEKKGNKAAGLRARKASLALEPRCSRNSGKYPSPR